MYDDDSDLDTDVSRCVPSPVIDFQLQENDRLEYVYVGDPWIYLCLFTRRREGPPIEDVTLSFGSVERYRFR